MPLLRLNFVVVCSYDYKDFTELSTSVKPTFDISVLHVYNKTGFMNYHIYCFIICYRDKPLDSEIN